MTDPSASCLTCPSYLAPEKVVGQFKKSISSPMCGRYGHVLGKPGLPRAQADKIARHYGSSCPQYGNPMPVHVPDPSLAVTLPDPDARVILDEANPAKSNCSSCAMCKNMVRDDIVAEELGWTAGLCAARGKLILSNKMVIEARTCEYRNFGTQRSSTVGLHLLPIYEDAFSLNSDPVKSYFKNKGNFVDPTVWPTDREPTEVDAKAGIRAWRKIVDPEGSGNEVFLPIYDGAHFSDEERAKIPQTGDDEHPELYIDHFGGVYTVAVFWTELDETPMLWGPAGTGKTELYRHIAWLMQLPFERMSITGSTELDDLAGKMLFIDGETTFQYGRLPLAWGKPSVVVIDEPNTGPPDVWQFLRPLTDNSKQLVLDMNKGERISRHADAFLGMAANPSWDPLNVGAASIGDADASRLMHVFVPLPPESLEREIIMARVALDGWEIDKTRLDYMMKIATELRALCEEGTLPMTWGIRPQLKVARALRWFDPITGYRRAVADYLEPESQDVILDVVRSHVNPAF